TVSLHAFPTRRSSDLMAVVEVLADVAARHRPSPGAADVDERAAAATAAAAAAGGAPGGRGRCDRVALGAGQHEHLPDDQVGLLRSEEHTSELQSPYEL